MLAEARPLRISEKFPLVFSSFYKISSGAFGMPDADGQETEELIERSARGDRAAMQRLLAKYRRSVRHMVVVRLDSRLAARVDPSDIVQEAFAEVTKRLPEYLRTRSMTF